MVNIVNQRHEANKPDCVTQSSASCHQEVSAISDGMWKKKVLPLLKGLIRLHGRSNIQDRSGGTDMI
jgi:hypothetical protein